MKVPTVFLQRVTQLLPHKRPSWCALVVYALAGAATTVVGMRVVRTKWFYSGTYEENYFAGLQALDALWFVLLCVGIGLVTLVLLGAYRALLERLPLRVRPLNPVVVFCVTWLVIFIAWVPYFMANFPGSLYADSIVIIRQGLGSRALSNHHPIFYVGLISLFLHTGKTLFDSYIMGIALYTSFQMVFISGMFAYFLSWLAKRGAPLALIVPFCVLFALFSIFPLHAVSMWKDGLYAACMLRIVLLLFDIVDSRGSLLNGPDTALHMAAWGLAVCLLRSNGIYVMALVWFALLVVFLLRRKGESRSRVRSWVLVACALNIGAYMVVVGPLSYALAVKTEPVESYGIPLQQTAAVVVYDGVMTPDQQEFVNSLLPLEKYKEEYIPCSVDGIKWADDFDTEFFDSHQLEYMQTWAVMAPANLGIYTRAFIMESYEYWSFADVNRSFTLNGVNDKYDAADLGIIETNLLKEWFGEDIANLFPFRFAHLQEGAASWIVLFMGLLFFVARKECWSPRWAQRQRKAVHIVGGVLPFIGSWWLCLLPLVANWLSVIISSPFAALPRYILPTYFALPFLIVAPWFIAGRTYGKMARFMHASQGPYEGMEHVQPGTEDDKHVSPVNL